MQYEAPPRGAVGLLNLLATEVDNPDLLAKLGGQFELRLRAHDRRWVHCWYWYEAFRHAAALALRELLRTPASVMATTLAACLSIGAAMLSGAELARNLQWAWIPPPLWHAYQVACCILMALLVHRAGAAAAGLLKGRELALGMCFWAFSTVICECTLMGISLPFWGLELPKVAKHVFVVWALASFAYTFGCWRTRQRRIARCRAHGAPPSQLQSPETRRLHA